MGYRFPSRMGESGSFLLGAELSLGLSRRLPSAIDWARLKLLYGQCLFGRTWDWGEHVPTYLPMLLCIVRRCSMLSELVM